MLRKSWSVNVKWNKVQKQGTPTDTVRKNTQRHQMPYDRNTHVWFQEDTPICFYRSARIEDNMFFFSFFLFGGRKGNRKENAILADTTSIKMRHGERYKVCNGKEKKDQIRDCNMLCSPCQLISKEGNLTVLLIQAGSSIDRHHSTLCQ